MPEYARLKVAQLRARKAVLDVEAQAASATEMANRSADMAAAAQAASSAAQQLRQEKGQRAVEELESEAAVVERALELLLELEARQPTRANDDERLWTLGKLRMQVDFLRRYMLDAILGSKALPASDSVASGACARLFEQFGSPKARRAPRRGIVRVGDNAIAMDKLGMLLNDVHEQSADLQTPRSLADDGEAVAPSRPPPLERPSIDDCDEEREEYLEDLKCQLGREYRRRRLILDKFRAAVNQLEARTRGNTVEGGADFDPLDVRLARMFGLDDASATPASIICAVATLLARTS